MAANVYWGVSGALAANASGSVLMIGDSWFWYPVDNLAVELGDLFPQQSFVVVGKNGSEAAEWATTLRKDIDYALHFYGAGAQALLLSGGGNDVAGMKDMPRLLKEDCSRAKTASDCFRLGEPDALLSSLEGAYRSLIARFRGHNKTATVVLQHYDYAWPTGKGLFGPADWLKQPMDAAKVPAKLRRDVFRALIDGLKDRQLKLAADASLGPVRVAMTAGVLPDDASLWANELHPTPKGFKLIAKKAFKPVLQAIPLA